MKKKIRTDKRIPLQKECILFNDFGLIKGQTVDTSTMGFGVKTDSTLPFDFKNGCEVTVIVSGENFPQAKLIWTKKDFNNTTRLGLKFLPA